MTETKRDYGKLMKYLKLYGTAPQVAPLIKISKHYEGEEKKRRYKQHIDSIVDSGQLDETKV